MIPIQFQNVTKRFTLHHDHPRSLQERFLRMLNPRRSAADPTTHEEYYALRDVSFEVEPGKTMGIIGVNGSGKSTALKLIAGIFAPTMGAVRTQGRLSALLELGAGMHPELTGRENIFLNGTVLGLSNAEMHDLFPTIVDFAELERFIDMPIKHYSSGMYMRLGFSVAIHTRPNILLVDEVLAVGDQAFQTKCLERLYTMRRNGTTIVFVSHSAALVEEICEEIVWLHEGELKAWGGSAQVANAYLRFLHQDQQQVEPATPVEIESHSVAPERQVEGMLSAFDDEMEGLDEAVRGGDGGYRTGDGQVTIWGVRLLDGTGTPNRTFLTGDDLTVEIYYNAKTQIETPMFGVAIHRIDGTHICGPNSRLARFPISSISGEGVVRFTIRDQPLLEGNYELSVSCYDHSGMNAYDMHWKQWSFRINPGGSKERYGLLRIGGEWAHERLEPDNGLEALFDIEEAMTAEPIRG